MYVKANIALSEYYRDIIADELNVKEVIFTDDVRAFTSTASSPSLRPWDRSSESRLEP